MRRINIIKGLAVRGQPGKEDNIIEVTITPLTPEERLYAYRQSDQLTIQTGCVGYLNVNADTGDQAWTTRYSPLQTDEFTADFDLVQKVFHFNDPATSFIHDRAALLNICQTLAGSSFGNGTEYGFRINTEQFSYIMRHEINEETTTTYIFAYRREYLDRHMEEAKRGIRFVTTNGDKLFTIPDGGSIRIRHPNGDHTDRVCRYIDSTHFEADRHLYHISQFAGIMEGAGNVVDPRDALTPREYEQIWNKRHPKQEKPKPKRRHDPQK